VPNLSTDAQAAGPSPVQAVRLYCLACPVTVERTGLHGRCWHTAGHAVATCPRSDCPLHPFRNGRNPHRAGIGGRPSRRRASPGARQAHAAAHTRTDAGDGASHA